jgi:hypothetical protein
MPLFIGIFFEPISQRRMLDADRLAEGEELGSNILRVVQRGPANCRDVPVAPHDDLRRPACAPRSAISVAFEGLPTPAPASPRRNIPTPRHYSPQSPSPSQEGRDSASSLRAMYPVLSSHRRIAASIPDVRTSLSDVEPKSRCCGRSKRAIWPRVT